MVLVIAGDGVDIKAIDEEISKQCNSLPRGEFALKALSHSFTVFARDMVEVSFVFSSFRMYHTIFITFIPENGNHLCPSFAIVTFWLQNSNSYSLLQDSPLILGTSMNAK